MALEEGGRSWVFGAPSRLAATITALGFGLLTLGALVAGEGGRTANTDTSENEGPSASADTSKGPSASAITSTITSTSTSTSESANGATSESASADTSEGGLRIEPGEVVLAANGEVELVVRAPAPAPPPGQMVQIVNLAPDRLYVAGGITIPPGSTEARVRLLGLSAGEATIVASLGTGPLAETLGCSRRPERCSASASVSVGYTASVTLHRVEGSGTPWHLRLLSLLGTVALMAIAWVFSTDRRRIAWRLVAWGVGLQLLFALVVLKAPWGRAAFAAANDAVVKLLEFTRVGTSFVLASYVSGSIHPALSNFVFQILPTIIFFSSLMTVLYHLGVVQWVVRGIAWVMARSMGTSGAESLSAAANIFVGQTEAPLVVRPYIDRMTLSELHAVMTGGMATIAGGVMAAYVGMLMHVFPDVAGHMIAASVMSAPAALVFAKLIVPEDGDPLTRGSVKLEVARLDVNVIDAAARGASDGLRLAANVGAMLLAFVALLAMLNFFLHALGGVFGFPELSLQWILGQIHRPLSFLMGVPWSESELAGRLMGEKLILTEFVAYLDLSNVLTRDAAALSYRSTVIVSYALCGFANFGSLAIQLGGIGGIAPSRRSDLARVGLRAMLAGTLAAYQTATIAGLLV